MSTTSGSQEARCVNCGEVGHWAMACYNERVERPAASTPRTQAQNNAAWNSNGSHTGNNQHPQNGSNNHPNNNNANNGRRRPGMVVTKYAPPPVSQPPYPPYPHPSIQPPYPPVHPGQYGHAVPPPYPPILYGYHQPPPIPPTYLPAPGSYGAPPPPPPSAGPAGSDHRPPFPPPFPPGPHGAPTSGGNNYNPPPPQHGHAGYGPPSFPAPGPPPLPHSAPYGQPPVPPYGQPPVPYDQPPAQYGRPSGPPQYAPPALPPPVAHGFYAPIPPGEPGSDGRPASRASSGRAPHLDRSGSTPPPGQMRRNDSRPWNDRRNEGRKPPRHRNEEQGRASGIKMAGTPQELPRPVTTSGPSPTPFSSKPVPATVGHGNPPSHQGAKPAAADPVPIEDVPTVPLDEKNPPVPKPASEKPKDALPEPQEDEWDEKHIFQEPTDIRVDETAKPLGSVYTDDILLPPKYGVERTLSKYVTPDNLEEYIKPVRDTAHWREVQFDPVFIKDGKFPNGLPAITLNLPQDLVSTPPTKTSLKHGRNEPVEEGEVDSEDEARDGMKVDQKVPNGDGARQQDRRHEHGRDYDGDNRDHKRRRTDLGKKPGLESGSPRTPEPRLSHKLAPRVASPSRSHSSMGAGEPARSGLLPPAPSSLPARPPARPPSPGGSTHSGRIPPRHESRPDGRRDLRPDARPEARYDSRYDPRHDSRPDDRYKSPNEPRHDHRHGHPYADDRRENRRDDDRRDGYRHHDDYRRDGDYRRDDGRPELRADFGSKDGPHDARREPRPDPLRDSRHDPNRDRPTPRRDTRRDSDASAQVSRRRQRSRSSRRSPSPSQDSDLEEWELDILGICKESENKGRRKSHSSAQSDSDDGGKKKKKLKKGDISKMAPIRKRRPAVSSAYSRRW